jgi:hypothetical protein
MICGTFLESLGNQSPCKKHRNIVSKEIKAEIGEIIFLSYFLAKSVKVKGEETGVEIHEKS